LKEKKRSFIYNKRERKNYKDKKTNVEKSLKEMRMTGGETQ